jgi:pimeloyl-ACP methyl ester carboxylesterase
MLATKKRSNVLSADGLLAEAPLGFNAGDANVYRYVRNDPTNAEDPSGLLGIFFDGAGYSAEDGSVISTLFGEYAAAEVWAHPNGGEPVYIRTNIGDLEKKIDGAELLVKQTLARLPNEPVDIIGWSRGAMAALALAKRLGMGNKPIKVRFLGLIEPTAPVKKWTEDKAFRDLDLGTLGDNVENVAIIRRDGEHDGNWAAHDIYKVFFRLQDVKFSEKTKILVDKKVPLNHFEAGFHHDVGKELWEAARKAGVALPEVGKSPYQADDYKETPRGGRGWWGNAEKLIRELKLLD